MSEELENRQYANELWRWYLTGEQNFAAAQIQRKIRRLRRTFRLLPGEPLCLNCDAPLSGGGAPIVKVLGIRPSSFSPRLCSQCEDVVRKYEGGAEVELSMLFADVRGSTQLAAQSTPAEYSQLIQKFYQVATDILIRSDALVNRLMGDQVIGLFVPRLAGLHHTQHSTRAAFEILRATGHDDLQGPWIPVGIGVHRGLAFVGSVGRSTGVTEIAVLGDAANLTARLSSHAAEGELILSEGAMESTELEGLMFEKKCVELKGMGEATPVGVIRVIRA